MTAPLFVLDGPQYHQLVRGEAAAIEGVALAVEGEPVEALEVRHGAALVAEARVDRPSPVLASLPLPGADRCRFECTAVLEPEAEYEFRLRLRGGETKTVFFYAAPDEDQQRMRGVAERVLALPFPPPELVATTQGGTNVSSYAHSSVSGLFTLRSMLRASGFDPDAVRSVLDVGCGTGRSLLGWYADDSSRRLAGADINAELIAWCRSELPEVAVWKVCRVTPPLDFDNGSFDLIQLASVFTHLPLPHQRAWLYELRRLLRPGGALVITLHGEIYARLLLDPATRDGFRRIGYAEVAGAEPGANAFATFHAPAFARELFGEIFPKVHWFPRGNDPARPSLFPLAALQDVWVMG